MKFGLFIPQGWRQDLVGIYPAQHWGVMAGLARRVDGNPDWESIWVYDHVHTVPRPIEETTHEAWSLMAAFAGVTGRVRLGQMCTCMGYRNPAYLAKVAATVDVISEGRLEMGIGAGWYELEHDALGFEFGTFTDRFEKLEEALQIITGMLRGERPSLQGRWYAVRDAINSPAPVGRIPIMIGGGGERKTLRIAAEHADIWHGFGDPELIAHKHRVLDQWCARVGRDPLTIERSAGVAYTPARLPERSDLDFAAQAQALFDVGTRLFTLSLTTPPYDFGPVRDVLAWRDGVNAGRG